MAALSLLCWGVTETSIFNRKPHRRSLPNIFLFMICKRRGFNVGRDMGKKGHSRRADRSR